MRRPPAILRLQIANPGRRGLRLWVPLFLLWPVMALVAAAALPLIILGAFLSGRRGQWVFPAIPAAGAALVSLCGLRIDMTAKGGRKRLHVELW